MTLAKVLKHFSPSKIPLNDLTPFYAYLKAFFCKNTVKQMEKFSRIQKKLLSVITKNNLQSLIQFCFNIFLRKFFNSNFWNFQQRSLWKTSSFFQLLFVVTKPERKFHFSIFIFSIRFYASHLIHFLLKSFSLFISFFYLYIPQQRRAFFTYFHIPHERFP